MCDAHELGLELRTDKVAFSKAGERRFMMIHGPGMQAEGMAFIW